MDSQKRDLILDSAHELFVRNGLKGTSMDDVAQKAAVGKGTLYLMCDNKADLFYQCVHRELQSWIAHVGRVLDPRRSAAELFEPFLRAGLDFLLTHELVRGLFSGAYAGLLPAWVKQFEELRSMSNSPMAEWLRIGIRHGELRSDVDLDAAAGLLQDMAFAGLVMYGDGWLRDREAVDTWVATQARLCLRGMRVRPRAAQRSR